MVVVKVPATSANVGAGFDCMGLALNLCSELKIEKNDSAETEIIVPAGCEKVIPADKRNYVYQAMEKVFELVGKKLEGYRIFTDVTIPMTRGLGSSSAAIVGGLVGANFVLGNPLSQKELLKIACDMEGHPDNVAPAILGGFVVSVYDGTNVECIKKEISDDVSFAAIIPDFHLQTKKSRAVLPEKVTLKDAVFNLSHAAFTAAAFIEGDFSRLKYGIKDKLHQDYRIPLIKGAEEIMNVCTTYGADACYLSGAGPTIMSIVLSKPEEFEQKLRSYMNNNGFEKWELRMLKAENAGATAEEL